MNIEEIAAVCHEANRAYCAGLGDHSQVPWAVAPGWQRDSAIKGVEFTRDNPAAPPSASHESWLAEKEATGRCAALAITNYEQAAMWAVKSATAPS